MRTFIVGGRGSGKTTRCIRLASEHFAYIVCCSHKESQRIYRQAMDMGFDIPFPITYEEFSRGEFSRIGIKGFVVDNVDMLVDYMARGIPVYGASMNVISKPDVIRPAAWEPPETDDER